MMHNSSTAYVILVSIDSGLLLVIKVMQMIYGNPGVADDLKSSILSVVVVVVYRKTHDS